MNFPGSGYVPLLVYATHHGVLPPNDSLLAENGDALLTESGDFILIES